MFTTPASQCAVPATAMNCACMIRAITEPAEAADTALLPTERETELATATDTAAATDAVRAVPVASPALQPRPTLSAGIPMSHAETRGAKQAQPLPRSWYTLQTLPSHRAHHHGRRKRQAHRHTTHSKDNSPGCSDLP
jgi:hypothetical protein